MTKCFYTWVTISTSILLFPLVVIAQQRAASPPAPHLAAPAHPMVASPAFPTRSHASSPVVVHPTSRIGSLGAHHVSSGVTGYSASTHEPMHSPRVRTNSGISSAARVLPADFADDPYATPGLGFDYPHFAAVNPGESHHKAYSHGGAISPFVGGGVYLPTTGYVDGGAPQGFADDSQQVEATEPAPDYPEAGPVEQTPISGRVRLNPSAAPAPSPEYIFVRRDGTVFFAVAYSWSNGNLQYVTQDGLRKLTSLSTLDLDATAQFNEQRGVAFHSQPD
jgi:hypothetical protein